jgi:hypothetical protein
MVQPRGLAQPDGEVDRHGQSRVVELLAAVVPQLAEAGERLCRPTAEIRAEGDWRLCQLATLRDAIAALVDVAEDAELAHVDRCAPEGTGDTGCTVCAGTGIRLRHPTDGLPGCQPPLSA